MAEPIRIAVTGGRDYSDRAATWEVLDATHELLGIVAIAHGACVDRGGELCGADGHADAWARARGYVLGETLRRYPADWSLGRRGGPIRNRWMLRDFRPDVLIAFPGGDGTASCVKIAREQNICVLDLREKLRDSVFR